MITIKQGESVLIPVKIFDRNNLPLDVSTATLIRAQLYIKNSGMKKYADTAITGYGLLEIDQLDVTTINILVTREDSKLFPIGGLSVSVLIDFPDNVLTDKYYEYNTQLGTVLKGDLKNETLV